MRRQLSREVTPSLNCLSMHDALPVVDALVAECTWFYDACRGKEGHVPNLTRKTALTDASNTEYSLLHLMCVCLRVMFFALLWKTSISKNANHLNPITTIILKREQATRLSRESVEQIVIYDYDAAGTQMLAWKLQNTYRNAPYCAFNAMCDDRSIANNVSIATETRYPPVTTYSEPSIPSSVLVSKQQKALSCRMMSEQHTSMQLTIYQVL